ncbi:hypothetical protein [Cellulomonas avistercoris]|uniref:hypothetical protein n=1 Tax=Cellulomonas avistercoris TaxID=2762242 RepID=UPI00296AB345|nr:hypothetical protein [Cellulomonas avistercoris]
MPDGPRRGWGQAEAAELDVVAGAGELVEPVEDGAGVLLDVDVDASEDDDEDDDVSVEVPDVPDPLDLPDVVLPVRASLR